jgi:multicomponent Na+:H+ antiporter subunit B
VSRPVRIGLFVPAALGLGAVYGWGVAGLHSFGRFAGRYGLLLDRVGVRERHGTNVVTTTVFDYRGFDTLGEEFMLFSAVLGVVLLLRGGGRGPLRPGRIEGVGGDALRVVGTLMVGGGLLVGLWLVAFGAVTPGGGFQGGVALASAALLLYLASRLESFRPFGNEAFLDPLEAVGAGGYVVIGLAALVSGGAFLQNLFSPGPVGDLLSGGSIPVLNWAVGLEVAAACLTLYSEFLQEYA